MPRKPAPGDRDGDSSRAERIRDQAMKMFAERGAEAASLRTIAAAAGVSLGLVQHPSAPKPTSSRPSMTTS